MQTFVKLPSGHYLNFANMTNAIVYRSPGSLSIRVCWNVTVGVDNEFDGGSNTYYGDDAEAIIDALDALAEAALRAAQ